MAHDPRLQRSVNKWSAVFVPVLLICIVGYVTWVIVALLAVGYLLRPPQTVRPQHGAAIAILVIFFLLLIPMALSYFRILQMIATNPGFVALPGSSHTRQRRHGSNKEEKTEQSGNEIAGNDALSKGYLDRAAVLDGRAPAPPHLESFYLRDVFECDIDGLPRWCPTCKSWKPDRSHHCSEVGRCVYKMDHFCPWAGGIISETNFKFFIQFCTYAALFCVFVLIITAYYLARGQDIDNTTKVNWIIVIVFAALFFCFSSGMVLNSVHFAFLNTTTVDSLQRDSRVQHFAVFLPNESSAGRISNGDPSPAESQGTSESQGAPAQTFPTITFPLTVTGDTNATENPEKRRFAILQSQPGTNPYRLTSSLDNMKSVLGNHWYDWLLPFRQSPCWTERQGHDEEDGSYGKSMYRLGPLLDEIRIEAGLAPRRSRPPKDGKERQSGRKTRETQRRNDKHNSGPSGPGRSTKSRAER